MVQAALDVRMLGMVRCSPHAASGNSTDIYLHHLEVAGLEAEEVWRVDVQHQREEPLQILGRHTYKAEHCHLCLFRNTDAHKQDCAACVMALAMTTSMQ
jgi:hypothetical protein